MVRKPLTPRELDVPEGRDAGSSRPAFCLWTSFYLDELERFVLGGLRKNFEGTALCSEICPGISARAPTAPGASAQSDDVKSRTERHKELLEWCSGHFDSQQFDIDEINRRLAWRSPDAYPSGLSCETNSRCA
jgi:hypothetical protein